MEEIRVTVLLARRYFRRGGSGALEGQWEAEVPSRDIEYEARGDTPVGAVLDAVAGLVESQERMSKGFYDDEPREYVLEVTPWLK